MEIKTRHNISNAVFVFYGGRIYKCRVKEIHITVDNNTQEAKVYYYLSHYTNNHNVVNGVRFAEDKVFRDIGELMAMFEIFE